MESGVYGKYAAYLPQVMDLLANDVKTYNEQYRARYGESAYEHFLYRVKSEDSMAEKCSRKGLSVTPESALGRIHDAIGLRIVCNFVDDVYGIVDYLRALSHVEVVEEKDYIRAVKPNGYRSYHMILRVRTPFEAAPGNPEGCYYAEVQLRTIAMDSWAALEHQVKYKKTLSGVDLALITAELKRCADELASCDLSMQTIRNLIREKSEETT
ncbi:MAG: GTP pyrophosphokinase family protein [Oscillospiraceae bacterium]|nr:GTP pyrophosphokinase family protein [Oscillospiraceae bacterium]